MRPVILIDVDGVLDPEVTSKQRSHLIYHHGWQQRSVYVDGRRIRSLLNPAHGKRLRDLAKDTGAELAWGTTWNEWANIHIGPRLGLPKLPVAPCPFVESIPLPGFGYRGKFRGPAVQWAGNRPFVWLDDSEDATRQVSALIATERALGNFGYGTPWHVVHVDENTGLTEVNIEEARRWLLSLRNGE